jgi:hypothetical protein
VRQKLTLKNRVDPATKPKVDPAKIDLSNYLKWRFIDRGGRYILQHLSVTYDGSLETEISRTWLDLPLVPETYIG